MAHVTVAKRILFVFVAVVFFVLAAGSAGLAQQGRGGAGRGGGGAAAGAGAGGAGPINAYAYADCSAANAPVVSVVIVTGAVPAAVPASTPQPSVKLVFNESSEALAGKTIEFSPDAAKGGPTALALSCPVVGDCVPARMGSVALERGADGSITGVYSATWPGGQPRTNVRFNAVWRESQKKCG